MNYCVKCGSPLVEESAFCPACGECVAREKDRALQEECLNTLYNRLCTERKCWRIFGFVFLGFCIYFSTLMLFPVVAAIFEGGNDIAFFVGMAVAYLMYAIILFLPFCIINFVVVSKLNKYIENYYVDCGPAVKRCGEPGAIVLGAICNEIALIFIIINFVYIKRNQAVFDEIRRNQLGGK